MIDKALKLNDAKSRIELVEALNEAEKKENEMLTAKRMFNIDLEHKIATEKMAKEEEINAKKRAATQAKADAELALQDVLNQINEAKLARDKAENDAKVALQKELEAIEEAKQKAYAETIKEIMGAVSPDLIAALSTKANADLLTEATKNLSPLAIARGESVAETVNTLMRGTSLEGILKDMVEKNN